MSGLLRRILPPIVVTALLVILAVVVWPMVFEPYEEIVPGPPSLAAKQNPLLALERLLAETGQGARRQSGLTLTPSAPTTVLLFPDEPINSAQAEQLMIWVADGGRLVYAPATPGEPDPLMDALGVDWLELDEQVEAVMAEQATAPLNLPPFGPGGDLELVSPLAVFTCPADHDTLRLRAPASDRAGCVAVGEAQGSGALVLVSSPTLFHNDQLGLGQHGRFAVEVFTPNRERALLITQLDHVRLLPFFWEHAAHAVVSLGLLIVVGLWRASRRFGPVLPEPSADRRSLRDALEARGAYLWGKGHLTPLLDALRAEVRAARRLPADDALAAWDELARSQGVPMTFLREALLREPSSDPSTFVRVVAVLAALRRSR
ncbi:MAG: hypothetical protein IPO67_27230 [Deltaproteobacteria bacterium]|nr:hypothetical protein [Deltaproteobacteria bacterium]